MTISEKIDGSNAAVIVTLAVEGVEAYEDNLQALGAVAVVRFDNMTFLVGAQSRNRLVFPGADNYGFAAWVKDNALGLAARLGQGTHYGEWWGAGIQCGYGLKGSNKRFSLFNVHRYTQIVRDNAYSGDYDESWVPGLRVVPTLFTGPYSEDTIRLALDNLENTGSVAEPGWAKPEGIIIFHHAAGQVFKVLLESDDLPKGLVA